MRSWLGLSSHRIPLVGRPGTVAVMADAETWDSFVEMAPDDLVNEACARIVLRMDKYRPLKEATGVRCPVLLQAGALHLHYGGHAPCGRITWNRQ